MGKWKVVLGVGLLTSAVMVMGCSAKYGSDSSGNGANQTPQTDLVRSNFVSGEVSKLCASSMDAAQKRLDEIGAIKPEARTFDNTVLAFESTLADLGDKTTPLTFMGYVSTDSKIRDEGSSCEEDMGQFYVAVNTRRDLYAAMKDMVPRNAEEQRLASETLRGFTKSGLNLSDDELAIVRDLRSQISKLEVQFSKNLNEDVSTVEFTKDELEGVSADALSGFKQTPSGTYIVTTKSTDYVNIMDNAKNPATRQKMLFTYDNRANAPKAGESNSVLLTKAIGLRAKAAKLLGYKTWADYQTDGRMAQTGDNVLKLLNGLKEKLSERNKRDIDVLLAAKKQMEDPNAAELKTWDIRYFSNQVQKRDFSLNDDDVKVYFPKDIVMDGLFKIYSTLLSVDFEEVKDAKVWHPTVKLYAIRDQKDHQIVGYFFTDFFPREGKYGHAAAFPLISGRRLADGTYSKPIASIVANLSAPVGDKPSLLSHDDVETVFHEFGHIMHMTLTKAPYASLSGSNVAQDFVEAPSQMLENWVWNEKTLAMMSGLYTDPSQKMPTDLLKKIVAVKNFNQGYSYTRQLLLGLIDMEYHTTDSAVDVTAIYNQRYKEMIGVDAVQGGHFVGTFGHLMGGYDAGYYGYIWSEVYAADMFSKFDAAGLLDPAAGRDYRTNILERGRMADPLTLVHDFLGRDSNSDAFYRKLGITP